MITTLKRITKFETSTEIEIRAYQVAKEFGHQWIPFDQALDDIQSTRKIRIVTLNLYMYDG